MAAADRRKYHTLDGMRGVAAIFVVARHMGVGMSPIDFPNSFIAVDLFFVLSGFVIAAAYDRRLLSGQLTAFRFVVLRFIRLWPLYVLGAATGLVVLYAKVIHGGDQLDLPAFHAIVPFALLMLPSVPTGDLSLASPVAWTLFYEMLINILYAVLLRWLGTTQLLAVATLAAAGIVAASLSRFGLDNGWAWHTSWIGLARVGYSFPVGILLYRYHDRLPKIVTSAWLVLSALALLLAFQLPPALHIPALATTVCLDITVLILLPALVAVAVNSEPRSRWIAPFNVLGVTSYAVYVLHPPLLTGIDWLASKLHVRYGDASPWSGMIVLGLILIGAWLADRLYDRPLRAWLTQRFDRLAAVRSTHLVRGS